MTNIVIDSGNSSSHLSIDDVVKRLLSGAADNLEECVALDLLRIVQLDWAINLVVLQLVTCFGSMFLLFHGMSLFPHDE